MSTRIVKVNPRSNRRPYRQYKLNQEYCSYYASHRTSLITYSIMQNRADPVPEAPTRVGSGEGNSIMQNRRIIKDMTNNKRK
jgi:hypothetical protein